MNTDRWLRPADGFPAPHSTGGVTVTMDDKEFRKLRREDLIEIIYQYQRRDQKLTAENEMLRRQLEDRRIRLQKAGSIADAALALSGVFEAAQKAADLYLQSLQDYPGVTEPAAPAQEKTPEKPAAEKPKAPAPQEKPEKSPQEQKPAEEKQEQKSRTEKKQAEPVKKPEAEKKPAEEKKLPPKPEKKAPAPRKAAAAPRKPAAEQKSAAPGNPSPAEPAGKETDEFIASLKEYLGM